MERFQKTPLENKLSLILTYLELRAKKDIEDRIERKKLQEYERSDRVCVEIQLKDVLDQGGLIYNVTSLPAYLKAYFCTLPEGKIKVKLID